MADAPLPAFDDPDAMSDDDLADLTAHLLEAAAEGASSGYGADIVHVATDVGPDDETLEAVPEPARRFRVRSLGAAEWARRKFNGYAAQLAQLDEQSAAWHAQIDEWYDRASAEPRMHAAFFEAHLLDYMLRVRAETQQASIKLPSGDLASTHSKPRISIVDEPALIAWVRANLEPDEVEKVVKVSERALVSELKTKAKIVDEAVGWTYQLEGCDHWLDVFVQTPEPALTAGELTECAVCSEHHAVVRWEPLVQAVVVDEAGRAIPGAGITPDVVTPRLVIK